MLTGISKKIEMAANIAIIVVACLLAAVLVKNYLVPKRTEQASNSESQSVNSPTVSGLDIDWRLSKQTLLLAVSSTCHFCTESARFYKELSNGHGTTRLIAVFPESVDEGRTYLERLGVKVDLIRQAPLSSINVTGTPTLLLVNSDGVVIKTWIGKLDKDQQQEVLNKML